LNLTSFRATFKQNWSKIGKNTEGVTQLNFDKKAELDVDRKTKLDVDRKKIHNYMLKKKNKKK
jgi:aspartyl/asparaginyl beta-hydroxylase (cupin superfamily)